MASFFDADYNGFSLLNPTLLGLMQGLGAASAPSRLPVTSGSVWGNIAGGLAHGQKAGLEQQMLNQNVNKDAIQNALLLNQLSQTAGALGQKTPSIEDIRSGKWQGFPWAQMFAGMGGGDMGGSANYPTPTKPVPSTSGMALAPPASATDQFLAAQPKPQERQVASLGDVAGGPPVPENVAAGIGAPGPGAPGMPPTPPPSGNVQLAQAGPMQQQAQGGLPEQMPPLPTLKQMAINRAFRSALGYQLTPIDQEIMAAASAQNAGERKLHWMAAYKAAGMEPVVNMREGGLIAGVNPATGQYEPQLYNPKIPEGAQPHFGPNGQMSVGSIPGALPTIGATAFTKSGATAAGALGPKLQEEFARPRELGPNASLATAGGLPSLPGVPGVPGTGMQGGGGPQMLHQGLDPMYQSAVGGQVSTDKDTIEKVLQPEAVKGGETQATAHLIGNLMERVKTGWGADTRQDVARIGSAMGIPPNVVQSLTGMDPAAGDALRKQFLKQTATAVRAMGAREPGSVISLFGKAYPNLETMEGATKLIENVLFMEGQQAKDKFSLAQSQHNTAVDAMKNGGRYAPMTNFAAEFENGPHSSVNYLRGAQAMSKDPAAWAGIDPAMQNQIYALIPKGTEFLAPDGVVRRKP